MLRLRTFGGLTIESDGIRVAELNEQRKALALLAVLARSGEAGIGREKLMALLWPDSDMDRGRNALKQMLHGIRRQLDAPDAVTGTSELSLNRSILSSDVAEFADAIARGDLEESVSLYRGPFLDAVHIERAPEFSRWQDVERASLTQSHLEALERLARAADESGRRDEAVNWWRQLSAADPLQSRGAIGLMRSLDAAGDRAGALRVAEQHQALLREELDAKPDADVAALAERLRSTSVSFPRQEPAVVPRPVAQRASLNLEAPGIEKRSPRTFVIAGVLAVVVLALVVLAVAVMLVPRGGDEAGAPPSGNRIVVAMFANQTGDSTLDPLRLLAADWMTRAIARTPSVDVLYPGVLYTQGQLAGGLPALPMDLARNNGAHLAIAGNYYEARDTLYFSASLIDVGTGKVLRVLDPVAGTRSSPLAAIEELRKRTSVAIESMLDARVSEFVSPASRLPPLDAYREFITAEDLHWRGEVVPALEYFARALELDSSFMLAAARMIATAAQAGMCDMVDSLNLEFSGRLDQLSPIERPTFGRAVARCDGDWEAATRHDRGRTMLQPNSPILQWLLATSLRQANRPAEALAIMSTLDPARDIGWLTPPRRLFYWRELGSAQHAIGDFKGERKTADGIARDNPNQPAALYFRARSYAGANNPRAALAVLEEFESLEARASVGDSTGLPVVRVTSAGWTMYNISEELLAHGHRPEAVAAARRAMQWLERRSGTERNTPSHRLLQARALEMTGDYDGAESIVFELLRGDSQHLAYRGLAGVLAARRGNVARAAGIAASLATGQLGDRSERARVLARAQIAAVMGKSAEAVSLLQSIPHRAHPDDVQLFHSDPAFYGLRDNAEFKAFIRPRG